MQTTIILFKDGTYEKSGQIYRFAPEVYTTTREVGIKAKGSRDDLAPAAQPIELSRVLQVLTDTVSLAIYEEV